MKRAPPMTKAEADFYAGFTPMHVNCNEAADAARFRYLLTDRTLMHNIATLRMEPEAVRRAIDAQMRR